MSRKTSLLGEIFVRVAAIPSALTSVCDRRRTALFEGRYTGR